jgi:glyoxylase-like metal-dependent hydrolase (beta-lactamase superfamily II)
VAPGGPSRGAQYRADVYPLPKPAPWALARIRRVAPVRPAPVRIRSSPFALLPLNLATRSVRTLTFCHRATLPTGRPARIKRGQRDNGPVIYRFNVGHLECAVVSDGQMQPPWEPPLAGFFTPDAGVAVAELQEAMAAEGRGRTSIACGYNCLLVRTADGHAVIDTGLGAHFLGYGPWIEPLVGRLGDRLASAGAPAADLAAVVFTHLHQDHCRGATWSGELTFPDAHGFAHAAEVAFWSQPDGAAGTGAAADEHLASAREAIKLFGERLYAFDDDAEILPGIRTVGAAGHTPGHTAVMVHSQGDRLLCVGDLFYDPLQLSHPQWCTPWDHDGAAATRSRRRLLDLAAEQGVPVQAYHMPFPGLGTVTRRGDAYAWTPLQAPE